MYLSQKQIDDYQNLGAIIIKGAFKDWIEPLRSGFQKVLDNPSQHGRENVNENEGRFFEDYCNWQRIQEFKDCMFNSPAAKIVAEATNSKSIQIFLDHLFINTIYFYYKLSGIFHQEISSYLFFEVIFHEKQNKYVTWI